ncbi:MAG TPA: hypothetical protein HA224_00605 [Nanoarchaeota archaeon]|nr:hypothetical protein [Nanoarchaeota archaeon]
MATDVSDEVYRTAIMVSGSTCSGKNVVAGWASENGFAVYEMGLVVREYWPAANQGHGLTEAQIRDHLRIKRPNGTFGAPLGVLHFLYRHMSGNPKPTKDGIVFIIDVVSPEEREAVTARHHGAYGIAVHCTQTDQLARIELRRQKTGRVTDLEKRLRWEQSMRLEEVMASAHLRLASAGTSEEHLENFKKSVGAEMQKFLQNISKK